MKKKEILNAGAQRFNAFKEYALLNELPESDFDGITELAAAICQVPISLITFAIDNRQIFKSHLGIEQSEAPLDESFCIHVIDGKSSLVVEDAKSFFSEEDIPISASKYNIQFYVGVPLFDEHGNVLGTLCVVDHFPRKITEEQKKSLEILAKQTSKLIGIRLLNQLLLESKNAYTSLFDQNPDAVFSFDLNGQFLSANSTLLRMLESTIDQLRDTTFERFILPSQLDRVLKSFKKACQGEPQNYDIEIRTSKNEKLILNITNIPNIQEGEIVGVFGIAKDITRKRQSEESLRNSEEKTRLLMNASLDAIIWVDSHASILDCNPQAEKTFGWKKEEVLYHNLVEIIAPPHHKSQYTEILEAYNRYGDESFMSQLVEQKAIDRNKNEFPIELTVIPVQQNEETFFAVFIRNISERKRFNDALKMSEKRYRNMFYKSPLSMWVCDLEGGFLDVNEAAIKHYGFSREEFLQMSIFDLSPEKDLQTKKNYIEKIIHVGFYRGETKHVIHNGKVIEVDLQCSEIDFANQAARLVLAIDISQVKYNERKLKSLTRELEEKVLIRTNELNQANELLSYEYQQTRDSIIYAQNIQTSVLHKDKDLEMIFPNSFVFFRPKDKVSGDFLWCAENEDYYLVAVVDCTGHGVPGAMISMVGFQLLNQIVVINGINSPSAVLTVLDKEINDLFHYNPKKSSSDGMDMIFCRVSKHTNELDFAGAQRPLFYYNPTDGLQEFKGNKLAIGGFQYNMGDKSFVETKITYQKGDVIYLTSDGYYSQFGGPDDKMMLKKRMIEQLELIGNEEMPLQQENLARFFREWKGNEEQIDDVLVVGVKL